MTEQGANLAKGNGEWLKATAIIINNPMVRSLSDRELQPKFSYPLIRTAPYPERLMHKSADQGRYSVFKL